MINLIRCIEERACYFSMKFCITILPAEQISLLHFLSPFFSNIVTKINISGKISDRPINLCPLLLQCQSLKSLEMGNNQSEIVHSCKFLEDNRPSCTVNNLCYITLPTKYADRKLFLDYLDLFSFLGNDQCVFLEHKLKRNRTVDCPIIKINVPWLMKSSGHLHSAMGIYKCSKVWVCEDTDCNNC